MKISKSHAVTGILLEDPEFRFTPWGKAVCIMLVNVDEDHQYWQAWDLLAEECAEHLQRNMLVDLTGTSKTQKWTDRNGKNHERDIYTASIVTWPDL